MSAKLFITLVFAVCSGAAMAEVDLSEAAYLSFGCNSCHIPGEKNGLAPEITGKDSGDVQSALMAYRNQERPNQLMQAVAGSLDDAQIKALAEYLSSVQPNP